MKLEINMRLNTRKGEKVIVTEYTVNNGYEEDSKKVKEKLELNIPYTVEEIFVEQFSSIVFLEEFKNIPFNTSNFENYESKNH